MESLPNTVGYEAGQCLVGTRSLQDHQHWLDRLARLLPDVQWLGLVQLDGAGNSGTLTATAPANVEPLTAQNASELARQAAGRQQALQLQIGSEGHHLLVFSLPATDPGSAKSTLPGRGSDELATHRETGAVTGTCQWALLASHADLPDSQLKTLIRLCRWAAAWLPAAQPSGAAESGAGVAGREALAPAQAGSHAASELELLDLVSRYRDTAAATLALVNLLQARFGCTRVSLGRSRHHQPVCRQHGTVEIAAVSGESHIDRRRKLARQLSAAMSEALTHGKVVIQRAASGTIGLGTVGEQPAHGRLSDEQGRHTLASIPLIDIDHAATVLLLEWPAAHRPSATRMQALAQALEPLPSLLALLDAADASAWQRLREGFRTEWVHRVRGHWRPGWRSALVAAMALLIMTAIVPMTYRVTAQATIEAADRQVIIAPYAGFVRSAHVRAGETVRAGQLLATLDDNQLVLEADKWRAEQLKNAQENASALALHDRTELRRLRADAVRIDAELSLVESRIERSDLRAPFDGVLISGDLSQSLGAPVEAGAVLFEIASADRYTLLLDVEDSDMGMVGSGQAVTVRMAALPDRDWQATLDALLPVAVPDQGSSVFRLPATLSGDAAALRPGMEGVGKISTTRHSMLWVFVHPLLDQLRLIGWKLGLL